MNRLPFATAAALTVAATAFLGAGQGPASPADRLTAESLKTIEFRSIGPAVATGRMVDVQIDPRNTNVWYVTSAFGGLWKTVNRGITFTPIFDDGGSFTLCCVAIDPKDSNVLFLGTGEGNSQRSAHFGDGVYKSTDAGKSWKRVGLASSEHIGKILIDPRNPKVVYVAAQGPLWSAGASAASTRRRTAAARGRPCCRSAPTRASATSCSIPGTPTSCSRRPTSGAAPSDR